jgi:hypothetical protein
MGGAAARRAKALTRAWCGDWLPCCCRCAAGPVPARRPSRRRAGAVTIGAWRSDQISTSALHEKQYARVLGYDSAQLNRERALALYRYKVYRIRVRYGWFIQAPYRMSILKY